MSDWVAYGSWSLDPQLNALSNRFNFDDSFFAFPFFPTNYFCA